MAHGKHHDGMEKEPKQPNGPRVGGKHPLFHSHSARPKRHVRTGHKRGGKR